MSKKIKELAAQAKLNGVEFDGVRYYVGNEETFLRFAELIVRECAGVCNDARDSTDFVTIAGITDYCAKTIMKRFGVGE